MQIAEEQSFRGHKGKEHRCVWSLSAIYAIYSHKNNNEGVDKGIVH